MRTGRARFTTGRPRDRSEVLEFAQRASEHVDALLLDSGRPT